MFSFLNSLRCSVIDKKMVNIIVGQIVRAVANDLRDLWTLFSTKLAPFVGQGAAYKDSNDASADDIRALLKFYDEKGKDVMNLHTHSLRNRH